MPHRQERRTDKAGASTARQREKGQSKAQHVAGLNRACEIRWVTPSRGPWGAEVMPFYAVSQGIQTLHIGMIWEGYLGPTAGQTEAWFLPAQVLHGHLGPLGSKTEAKHTVLLL